MRQKPLSHDDLKKVEALHELAKELEDKLAYLCNNTVKSPHQEDCELDTCEYLAGRIQKRIKEIRGTGKVYRTPAEHARSGNPVRRR